MRKITLVLPVCLLISAFGLLNIPARAYREPAKAQKATKPAAAMSPRAGKAITASELVGERKVAGVAFDRKELFKSAASAAVDDPFVRKSLKGGAVFELDHPAVEKILREEAATLLLPLPDGEGGAVELELVKVDIFAPGFTVRTAKPTGEDITASLGVHYRGVVKGDAHSLAAISVFRNEVMGFYSTPAGGNKVLGRLGGDNPADKHVLYARQDLQEAPTFACDMKDNDEAVAALPSSILQEPEEVLAKCIRIYIEADYDIYLNRGSVSGATSLLTSMFNQSATLFANDGIPVSLSDVFVWNVQSPYAGFSTTDTLLKKFQEVRNSFNGDFGHFVSLRGGGGLAATFNSYCNANPDLRQCVSGISPFVATVPAYSDTVFVFTHELGHLLGSRHTHACVWNGNGTAIDSCGPTYDPRYTEGSCTGAPIPFSTGGTIMSYCALLSGVGVNFSLGFGTQPRNVILNSFNAAGCLIDCGGGGGGPANNNFASAQVISNNSGNANGTTTGATKEAGEPAHAGNVGGASIWYRWQAPASGTVTLRTAGSSFDTLLAVYTGSSVGALTQVASNDDVVPGVDLTSALVFNATAGTTYRIAIDGWGGETGTVALNWNSVAPAPPNNNFVNAQTIAGASGSVGGTNIGATKELGEPNHGGDGGGASVWYQWQAPFTGNATFTTAGSSYDTLLGAYTGTSVSALTFRAGNDDVVLGVERTSIIVFPVTAGTIYRFAVDGWGGDNGSITLNWNLVSTCTYSISPASQSFTAAGGTGSVGVTSQVGCAWTAASNSSFVTVSSGASGSGNGTVNYAVAANASTSARTGTLTVAGQTFTVSQAASTASTLQLSAAAIGVNESSRKVSVNVTRAGNTSAPATVDYATADGTALRLRDYTQTLGTLVFSPGETTKTVTAFVTDDVFAEVAETFSLTLTNASGATLGTPATVIVTINSDDATNGSNPVGDTAFNADFFVRQHYVDFLNREADAGGLAFWTGDITQCSTNVACRDGKRVNVSAAFFLSIEFQNTGYLVYRTYKAAYGDATSPNVAGTVPAVRLNEFLPDTQRIGQNVVVNQGTWEAQLEANKQAYSTEFVLRQRFLTAFPLSMTPAQFVDKLRTNTGTALTQAERDQLVSELSANNTTAGRASVLRKVAEDATLRANESNRAFVLMQYYGYLRRNPDDAPEVGLNYSGWKFWLDKLNQFGGNYVAAEMVKAFITSTEYRQRFGP